MSEEEKQLARDCAQLNFTTSVTTALLNLRKGLGMPEWKDSQIENFLKVEKEQFSNLIPNSSSVDKLIYSFKQRGDVNFLYVTYRPDEGMLMMTQKKRKQVKDFSSGKNKKELDQSLKQLYIANTLSGDDRLLLFFLYASEEEMRLVRMHPEFACCDTTFGTNNEKKELLTLAFLDGNNKGFNGGKAFIQSSQAWVFDTIFKHCLPLFWGAFITSRLFLIITDGCVQEWTSFIGNCRNDAAFPNAVLGLCYFHLAIVGFDTHVMPSVPKTGMLIATSHFIVIILRDMFHFIPASNYLPARKLCYISTMRYINK